jgi:glycosyltransferase involved in cell wall biosynthesis
LKVDVLCFAGDSGLGHYSISLARALSADPQMQVRIVTSANMPAMVQQQFPTIVTPFRRTRQLPVDAWRALGAIIKNKPDAVVFQSWQKVPLLEVVLIRLLQSFGVRCFCTVHDVQPHTPKPWSNFDIPLFFKAFDGLIAHSLEARERLEAMGCRNPISVIPHGIYDIFNIASPTRQAARERIGGLADTAYVALFFGHVETRKGILDFIKAAPLLAAHPEIKLIVAGKSKSESALAEQLAVAKSIDNLMVFDEYIPFEEVQDYFSASDVVVMPYHEGSTSGVMKLAIAFRRPVLSTDIGDAKETINNPALGSPIGKLLRETHSPAAIAEGILEMQSDQTNYAEGLEQMNEMYSWKAIGRQYSDFLKRVSRL